MLILTGKFLYYDIFSLSKFSHSTQQHAVDKENVKMAGQKDVTNRFGDNDFHMPLNWQFCSNVNRLKLYNRFSL
jgi:hypothetical protein